MLGLQLYTVRDKIKDAQTARATLEKIREMGYECVQLAGDIATVELTALAASAAEVRVIGFLVDINVCEADGERLFALARLCGASDIGISSTVKTDEEVQALIPRVNCFAKKAREEGFSFSYHNHSNEFIRGACGKTLMQQLLEGFDPALVDLMPDTYWLQHGGMDVRDFLESVKGRVNILHLKDMKRTAEGQTYAAIGEGNINFRGILATARVSGISHLIVEQDRCDGDSLDAAHASLTYVRALV